MNTFEMIRDANVKVEPIKEHKRKDRVNIIVNDDKSFTFPKHHAIHHQLEVMTPEQLGDRLSGGQYFFVGDQLMEYRDGSYEGMVHTDDDIGSLMEHLGTYHSIQRGRHHRANRANPVAKLGKVWNKNEFQVEGLQQGGTMESRLTFEWSPFQSYVDSSFDVIRLVCANGMVALNSLFNTKVPLVNRWAEHLSIASDQMQFKMGQIVNDRMQSMIAERASVQDIMLLDSHIDNRLKSKDTSQEQRMSMWALRSAMDLTKLPQATSTAGSMMPSHITALDAYNIVTELRTHTNEATTSSSFALDKLANGLMFDSTGIRAPINTLNHQSPFSNPEEAFFGLAPA